MNLKSYFLFLVGIITSGFILTTGSYAYEKEIQKINKLVIQKQPIVKDVIDKTIATKNNKINNDKDQKQDEIDLVVQATNVTEPIQQEQPKQINHQPLQESNNQSENQKGNNQTNNNTQSNQAQQDNNIDNDLINLDQDNNQLKENDSPAQQTQPLPEPVQGPFTPPVISQDEIKKYIQVNIEGMGNYQVEFEDGDTGWSLMLRAQNEYGFVMDYQDYGWGIMITQLGDTVAEGTYYWALYYNEAMSWVGITDLVLHTDDVIEWKYESWM